MPNPLSGASVRRRIAFLTPSNPIDADSGGKQFTLDRLLGLAELADVDVFCLEDAADQRQRLSDRLGGRPVYSAGSLKPRTGRHWLESMVRAVPLSVWRNDVAELSHLIERHGATPYDLIYVDHWLMWPASTRFHIGTPRLLNLHNAEHLIFERAAQQQRGLMRTLLRLEAWRVRRYLLKIGRKAAAVHAISETDRRELAAIGIPTQHITSILPCVEATDTPAGRPGGRVLFAGTLSWAPNAEGLEWFLRKVLPDLSLDQPVQVVGGTPPAEWLQLPAAAKVEFLGRVPSMAPLYADAGVMIAPVFSGSGIKLKIVNSMAQGLPVVTTACGIEGFPAGWEKAVRVCDDPVAFGQAVRNLLEDAKSWSEASRHAQEYAARHFSVEAARMKLEECLNAHARP